MSTFKWVFGVMMIALVLIGVAGVAWAQSTHPPESTDIDIMLEEEQRILEVANCPAADVPLTSIFSSSLATQTTSNLDSTRSCPACSIPSDPRVCCIQYADHYSPCATDGCGPEQQRWHRCWRYCYPNQQSCGGWNTIDKGCVYSNCNLRDSCQSCSGSCPFKAAP